MAKSVDNLIDFLLEEIALSGSRGASINELGSYVRSFYNGSDQSRSDKSTPLPAVSVDSALLSKVWTWLGRHPDVSLGDGKKYNKTSLQEVEVEFPGCLDQVSPALEPVVHVNDNPDTAEDVPSEAASEKPNTQKHPPRSKEGPHVTVNYERMYRAICGHPPDTSKIVPLEFALLSHIAATRSVGILQGPLTRASGQDKRSVPRRTDELHRKGYIVKEPVYAHGTKTSRLTLRKLAATTTNKDSVLSNTTAGDSQQNSTVRGIVRGLFQALSDQDLIPQNDLAERLEMTAAANFAILTKVIRRLERLKFVKRVKTAFGPSATVEDLKQCIQLVRLPGPGSLDEFDTEELALRHSLTELASMMGIEEPLEHFESNVSEEKEMDRDLAPSPYIAPAQWNPNRLMPNMLRDAVQLAGAKGLTNVGARKLTTGLFIRRAAEASLFRLSCRSLLAQPSHLKHLAVVRAYVTFNGVAQFFHYSWDTFRVLAQVKTIDTTQIPGAKKALASFMGADDEQARGSASTGIDSNGFPSQPPSLQIMRGAIDLADIIKNLGIEDIPPRYGEPVIVETEPGHFSLAPRTAATRTTNRAKRVPANSQQAHPKRAASKQVDHTDQGEASEPEIALGRPRKYVRGTEKFWRKQFAQAIIDASAARGIRLTQAPKKAMMKHPDGLALYERRPPDFDATLLKAIDAHFPVPAEPHDISEQWVQATKLVLDRHSDGIYLTPKGLLGDSKKQQSQILVFRSSRLKEVNFAESGIVFPVRFLSSSASHTFADLRSDQTLSGNWRQASIDVPERIATARQKTQKNTKHRLGPQKGVFFDDDGLSVMSPHSSPPPRPTNEEGLGLHKVIFLEDDKVSVSNSQVSPPHINMEKSHTRESDETTDEDIRVVQARPQVKRKRPVRTLRTAVGQRQQDDQASPPSQQISPPTMSVATTGHNRSRPLRKRKLTEKARQHTEAATSDVDVLDAMGPQLLPTEHIPSVMDSMRIPQTHEVVTLRDFESGTQLPVPVSLTARNLDVGETQTPATTTAFDAGIENQSVADFLAQWNISATGSRLLEKMPAIGSETREFRPTATGPRPQALNDHEIQLSVTTAVSDITSGSRSNLNGTMNFKTPDLKLTEQQVPLLDQEAEAVIPVVNPFGTPPSHEKSQLSTDPTGSTTVMEKLPAASTLSEPNVHISCPDENPSVSIQEELSAEVHKPEKSPSNITEVLDSSASEPERLPTRRSVQRKRRRVQTSEMEDTDFIADERSPSKRAKEGGPKYTAGSNSFCKKLVLHLMSITKGAAPNDAFTLRRLAVPRWKEEGYGEGPLLKAIKLAIKRLCASGKLKQTSFTFRGKAGVMVRRSILYLPTVSSDSDSVANVKQSIIAVEPADYIPPEWTEEASLLPLFITMPRLSESSRKRRQATPASDVLSDVLPEASPARSPSPSPLPETPPGAATGFVTLKVARLGILPVVHLENWQNDLGRVRERAEAAAFAQRRERSSRSQGLHSRDRRLKWANKLIQDFPTSLQDIILVTPAQNLYASADFVDRNWHRFAREIEAVEAWEQNLNSAAQNFRTSYAFINHSIPAVLFHDTKGQRKVDFSRLIHFDENGLQKEIPFPPESRLGDVVSALAEKDGSHTAKIAVGTRETLAAPPILSDHEDSRPGKRKRKRKGVEDDTDFRPAGRRKARATTRQPKTKTTSVVSSIGHKRFVRGIQYLRDLPAQQVRRLAVSVVVVRTLLGGLDSIIDWPVVMTLFPNELQSTIQGRWKTLSTKYRGDIRGLTESLQARYLQALEANQVPCVNFADIKATDWRGIVEWAIDNLDRFDVEGVAELPADKASLIEENDFSFVELRSYPPLLVYANNITTQMKENTFSATIFGSAASFTKVSAQPDMNLRFQPRYEKENSDPSLRLARSWVFASILTADPGFDPDFVRSKLAMLASSETETNDLLHRALKVLQDEKLVQKATPYQKSIVSLSRGVWEPAKKFYERFEERRMINAAMLRQAMTFKLSVADAAFQRGESISVPKETIIDDGTMVAIINLMSTGQIKPRLGADIPRTRYGLDWEQVAYSSRHMEKSAVEFTTRLVSTAHYVPGDLTRSGRSTPIPRGQTDTPMGHIPPWLDIHARFQPKLWEMFVAGALGLVVQLPGISAREISRTLGFALDEAEVALLMGWCVDAGFALVDAKSNGYETTDVWWQCLSTGDWDWVVTAPAADVDSAGSAGLRGAGIALGE